MLDNYEKLIKLIITSADEELLTRFNNVSAQRKSDGSWVTEADLALQKRLEIALREQWPEYNLLGEEMSVAEQLAVFSSGQSYWCLDPLDGTSNFASGFPFFGVSLALIQQGRPQLAVIYDPIRRECFHACAGQGAFLNGQRIQGGKPITLSRALAVVDFKRLTPVLAVQLSCTPPYHSQRYLGSSVLEWCWLATGRFQVYLHGKQSLWDYAAGLLILQETGGCVETMRGGDFFCDLAPCSILAATSAELLWQWREALNLHSNA